MLKKRTAREKTPSQNSSIMLMRVNITAKKNKSSVFFLGKNFLNIYTKENFVIRLKRYFENFGDENYEKNLSFVSSGCRFNRFVI